MSSSSRGGKSSTEKSGISGKKVIERINT